MIHSMPLLFGMMTSPLTALLLIVLVVLFFGGRLPEVARSFGRSINEFKKGLKEGDQPPGDAKPGDPPKPAEAKPAEAKPAEPEKK